MKANIQAEQSQETTNNAPAVNKRSIMFGITAAAYQGLIIGLFSALFNINGTIDDQGYEFGNIYLATGLSLLTIVGFGLINSYNVNGAFSGIGLTLLTYALSIQHFFLFRAASVAIFNTSDDASWQNFITLVNVGLDKNNINLQYINIGSFVDAVAFALCMNVVLTSIIDKINLLQLFIMTLFGAILYEVNTQILWALCIYDLGYGMRVFIFGSFMGTAIILCNRKNYSEMNKVTPIYSSRTFGLIGLIIVFLTFPFLCLASIYRTSFNNSYIIYIAVINMYFALCSGVLGSLAAITIIHSKVHMHILVLNALSGGVIFSSSCNMHKNPAIPLAVGFIGGFIISMLYCLYLEQSHKDYQENYDEEENQSRAKKIFLLMNRFLLAGILCGIVSAITAAVPDPIFTNYIRFSALYVRTSYQQGGFQFVGLLISSGLGIIAGVIVGFIIKLLRRSGFQLFSNVYEHEYKSLRNYTDDHQKNK